MARRAKKLIPWVVGIIAFYFVFLFAENLVAPTFDTCVAQSSPNIHSARQGQSQWATSILMQNICSLRLVDRHNGFFALLGTLAVAGFTLALWRSTDKLWEAGERTAERQLRAYIHVGYATFLPGGNSNVFTNGWVDVKIKNYGATPATNFVLRCQSKIDGKSNAAVILELSDESFEQPRTIVPPGADFNLQIPLAADPIDKARWLALAQQEKAAFVWGRMDYDDAFNNHRYTEFQLVCDFQGRLAFSVCKFGNAAA